MLLKCLGVRTISIRHESANLSVDKLKVNFDGTVRRILNQADPNTISNPSELSGDETAKNQARIHGPRRGHSQR